MMDNLYSELAFEPMHSPHLVLHRLLRSVSVQCGSWTDVYGHRRGPAK